MEKRSATQPDRAQAATRHHPAREELGSPQISKRRQLAPKLCGQAVRWSHSTDINHSSKALGSVVHFLSFSQLGFRNICIFSVFASVLRSCPLLCAVGEQQRLCSDRSRSIKDNLFLYQCKIKRDRFSTGVFICLLVCVGSFCEYGKTSS